MTRSNFTEEQFTYALRQVEAGTPAPQVCRELGMTEQTFYRWRRKYAGIGVAELWRVRVFTIVDNFSRMSPALRVSRSLPGRHVVEVLEDLNAVRGVLGILCVDHGPEGTSRALDVWAQQHGVDLDCSRPGTPTDQPCIVSFNAKLRVACLDQHGFTAIEEAETMIEDWREDDIGHRPHRALGGLTPEEFESGFSKRQASRARVGSPPQRSRKRVQVSTASD